ncbi:MAG: hypothetical protein H0U18_13300 [Pyrinomonadaceae bacterium]|nr:hypothetical protein [Pyrinomonadaceae bacterium]
MDLREHGHTDGEVRIRGSAAHLAECLWLSGRTIIDFRGYASLGRHSLKSLSLLRKGKALSPGRRPSRRCARFPHLRVSTALLLGFSLLAGSSGFAQGRRSARKGSHSSALPESLSRDARNLVESAIDVICTERKKDPKGSHPIDEMQARPSLPVYSVEAVAGAQRAQRLLPVARDLVAASIEKLATEYKLQQRKSFNLNMQRAIGRVQIVRRVKPDMASRDNASVFLRRPRTITFGTIFLAGLPSDEAMISVLAHELVHIADGDGDSLRSLFRAVGNRASGLTRIRIHEQRAEELTCDLVGTMAARSFVSQTPDYSPLSRRISRAVQHNCVEDDEGDEDHLSPRNTIRALLALSPSFAQELVYGQLPSRSRRSN